MNHTFADPALREEALTHPSWSGERGGPDYQRLEFLGDAVLKLVASELIVGAHPSWSEGELSIALQRIVSNQTLAPLADALGLPAALRMGVGARARHEERRVNVRADVFEAMVGAVFKDGGIDAARAMLAPILAPLVDGVDPRADAKSRLQELCQARKWGPPVYSRDSTGAAHELTWIVMVAAGGGSYGPGEGSSLREAELAAAAMALSAIG